MCHAGSTKFTLKLSAHRTVITFFTTRYLCRSVEYDEQTHLCVLSEEDSVSQKDDLRTSSSPTHHLYDLVCLDNRECSFLHTELGKSSSRDVETICAILITLSYSNNSNY